MQTEIEIKAKVFSLPVMRKKISKIGARKINSKKIVDIYYTPEKGEKYYGKGSRLKFRIRYDGKSNEGRLEVHKITGLLDAIEYEQPISDVKMMKQMLKELKYKQCAVVDKVRELYNKLSVFNSCVKVIDLQVDPKELSKEELVEFMNKLYIENVWCFGKYKTFDLFRHTRRATLEGLF